MCLWELNSTKCLPANSIIGSRHGVIKDLEREGACVEGWLDFVVPGHLEQPVYTEETIETASDAGEHPISAAMWLVAKDICDAGGSLSHEWYQIRICYEYFREYPVPPDNAYLIGELFKELCGRQMFEGDLRVYCQGLLDTQARRKAGAASTKANAEQLREFCVALFADMEISQGARLILAPPEVQAEELKSAAMKKRPLDFLRDGKP